MTEALAAQPELVAPRRRRRLTGSVGFWLAAAWLAALVLAAATAAVLPIADPLALHPSDAFAAPGRGHWFGADQLGRDQFSRVVYGARVSLTVGITASVLAAVVGGALGLISGYFGGFTENAIMGVVDILLAFPALILALSLTAFLGASVRNVITAIAVLAVPAFVRVTRSVTKSLATRDFVQAAQVLGGSHWRIITRELAPNVFPTVLAYTLVTIAIAMVVEGALSFLGLGVPPPDPTWGTMIAANKGQLATAPYLALIPAGVLLLTVLALNVLGERLQGRADR
jgi:peptide/nickel transport system permease protein